MAKIDEKEKGAVMKDPLTLLDNVSSVDNDALQAAMPPIESWQPNYCGDSEITIHRDGTWSHQGQLFKRDKLVKLFANIIRLEDDGQYYLVTPVEKMLLTVEDAPFLAVGFEVVTGEQGQRIVFETNVGDRVVVDSEHPIIVYTKEEEPAPYVIVRKNLKARIARSMFYQLVDIAEEEAQGGEMILYVESCNERFELGRF